MNVGEMDFVARGDDPEATPDAPVAVDAPATSTPSTSRWFRANLWVHRWASLVATLPFLVLCVTGTVLIFHEEIDAALGAVPAAIDGGLASPRPLQESVANVLATHPGKRVLSLGVDREGHPGVLMLFTAPAAETGYEHYEARYANLATAELLGDTTSEKSLTGVLLELHAQWFLGPAGELLGAVIALLVLASLVSGLVIYAPYVRRVAFGLVRRGRGTRLLQLDLHNFIGALVLGWALVVTTTGFFLGFGTIATGLWQQTELARARERFASGAPVDALHPPIDVDQALASARAAAPPGWRVGSLMFPHTDFSTDRHYAALLNGASGLEERMFRAMLIDAETGDVAVTLEIPAYLKAIMLSQPLHFGDYGGLPLKLLWTLCTWLTLFITGNGAWLWWNRRPRRAGQIAKVKS